MSSTQEYSRRSNLPRCEIVDKIRRDRADRGADEWTRRVYHHRCLQLRPAEHVADGTTSDAQKSASGEAIKEAGNEHCLDVLSNGARDQPDHKKREGHNVDGFSAIELPWFSAVSWIRSHWYLPLIVAPVSWDPSLGP